MVKAGSAGTGRRGATKVHVVSAQPSFTKAVKRVANHKRIGVFASTEEAVQRVLRSDRPKMEMVVIDLTSAGNAHRLIHFLKWATPTCHVRIIGVGHDEDFLALAPDALRLLDGAVKKPFAPHQLVAAAVAARRIQPMDASSFIPKP